MCLFAFHYILKKSTRRGFLLGKCEREEQHVCENVSLSFERCCADVGQTALSVKAYTVIQGHTAPRETLQGV